jgi:zinc protease
MTRATAALRALGLGTSRILRAACVVILAACAGAAQAQVRIQHWTTGSGARVYFVETRAIPVLDVAVEFPAGSAWDAGRPAGVARLTLEMLKAGSARFSEDESNQRLADVGAELREDFDRDRAGFFLRTLSSERARALEVVADLLQAPRFPDDALERERALAIGEVQETETQPEGSAERRLYSLMYAGHPYGIVPTAESLAAVTRADVERFYRERYRASRAVVTVVGDVDREAATAIADALTARLPAGADDGPRLERAKPPARGVLERIARPSAQSHVLAGMAGISRDDPDYFSLFVGNFILGGGGFVSRLYKEVREKRGYAYSAYSYFMPLGAGGPFLLGLQTRNDQADEALAQARAVLDAFIKTGPTEGELAAAKRSLVGSFPLRIDSNRKLLDQAAMIGFYQLPLDWLDRFIPSVKAVTLESVRAAFARRVRTEELTTVIAGAAQ